ncbi:MAG: 1,4-dihydroxy-2-naphthoate polyprenyltransferase [Thermotogaceae bacterium]|nr:1,4-dihydroxy-2-naphthoate polyprenyltransferase [Thermotogaceae bacterium]
MVKIKYLVAIRPFAFPASVFPVTIGALVSMKYGNFSPPLYILSLIAAILIHSGVNTSNDIFDYLSGVDREGTLGSSGLLVNKKISLKELAFISFICFAVGILIGIFLTFKSGPWLLLIGALGVILGYFYTGKPFQLKYRGLGLFIVFVLMGPLMVFGAEYVQRKTVSFEGFLLGTTIGIATTLILLSNEIRDSQDDKQVGIKSLAIVKGDEYASKIYLILSISQYVPVIILVINGFLSILALLSVISIFIYLGIYRELIDKAVKRKDSHEIKDVDKKSAFAETIMGVFIILGMVV